MRKKDLIHKLQAELEKANERVSTLSLKCQERSKENKRLKADAIREKDYQLDIAGKEKADLLTSQQRHLSEMEQVDQIHAEQVATLERSLATSI